MWRHSRALPPVAIHNRVAIDHRRWRVCHDHRHSPKWECNITGRPIWFRSFKLTFSTCFHVVVAQQWHGRDAVCGFDKRPVLWIDWVVLTSYFYGSHKGSEKAQLLYAGCVHFTVDWLFWNLYGSYIAPRPLLSWKKPGNFSFDNIRLKFTIQISGMYFAT